MQLTKGIDVSYAQGKNLNWKQIKAAGIEFVIARAGHGVTKDATFEPNILGAKWEGLSTGAYWFFEADHDSIVQAHMLYESALITDMVPYLDFETLEGRDWQDALHTGEECAQELIKLRESSPPILYTCYNFWEAVLHNPVNSPLTQLDLWVAHYGVKSPLIPTPWRKSGRGWRLWQYDGDGGERLPDGRDSDFIWMDGPPEMFAWDQGSCPGQTCEGPMTSRASVNNLIDGWVQSSLDRAAESVLEENAQARREALKNRDD